MKNNNQLTLERTHQTYSNATGNPEYYIDKFKYDLKEDIYICPMGFKLYRTKSLVEEPERIKYMNYEACSKCPNKDLCTKAVRGRVISRSKDQDFLDIVDARTYQNLDKYRKRQMIVEHPFGTVKRTMNAGYFLTRGLESVRAEASLTFLAYNMKRVMNTLGIKEILRRLRERISYFIRKMKNSYILLDIRTLKKHVTVFET